MFQVGQILVGPTFNEPMRVVTLREEGDGVWTLGLVGKNTERFISATLSRSELASLRILSNVPLFDGDGSLLRLGLQAYQLGVAYEFDPYFGLSISRVDPLPHQLEAVYDYLLKLARVRFLLADDAGAGNLPHPEFACDSADRPWEPPNQTPGAALILTAFTIARIDVRMTAGNRSHDAISSAKSEPRASDFAPPPGEMCRFAGVLGGVSSPVSPNGRGF